MTTWRMNPDGTRTWTVNFDALEAAALLEDTDLELTKEEFDELTDEMRKAREEADAEEQESGGHSE